MLHQKIQDIVSQIPTGKVASYGQISKIVGGCTARMVGFAMASLPQNTSVPWHRVINSQGKISPHGLGYGSAMQRKLLEDEGVVFDASGKIDWVVFGWIK